MTKDQSYIPMHNDFRVFMEAFFPNVVAPDQVRLMRSIFFAGAAASYQVLTETPERQETLFAEIADDADQLELMERA